MKTRTSHRSVLLRATLLASLTLFAIITATFLLNRQLRDNERSRAVSEARQLTFGLARQSGDSFERMREEFVFSLGNLPYLQLLLEEDPRLETLLPVRRFLSLNQNLVRALVVTSPDGLSRSATLDATGYLNLSPRSSNGSPGPDPQSVSLSGIVQGSEGQVLASVVAILDPVRFWRDSLTTFSLSHPNLWIHLIDTEGRAIITRHGGNQIKAGPLFEDAVRAQLRADAREGYEDRLYQSVVQDGETLKLISAYAPVRMDEWSALLMASADERIVLGPADQALRKLALGALGLLLLVIVSFVLFIRHTLRNQAQIEDDRLRIETVLNTVQSGIILVNAHTGRVTEVNAAATALLDHEPGDILGNTIDSLRPSDHKASLLGTSSQATSFEARMRTRSGTERHVLAATAPLTLTGTLHTLCSFVDITALKETESRLQEAVTRAENSARAAEAANRAKSAFLAMISHELRTPLNSILGLSEAVLERVHGPLTEKQDKYLRLVLNSGRDLLDVINDILDLAHMESDPAPLSLAACSVRTLCEASILPVRVFATRRNQTVEVSLPTPDVSVRADSRRFQKTLGNLLANASKFTPAGGTFGLHVETTETEVSMCVWDHGIGIAPQNLERIFDPFVQLDARLSREYEGTGLGLTLVKRIVTLHGGRIEVASTPGQGSSFTIVLPRAA